MKNPTFESLSDAVAERCALWLWLPGVLSSFVQELSQQRSQGWVALWEAQPCQHSRPRCVAFTAAMVMLRCSCRETESQEMQGLSWEQGNHLGSQWGLGEFDLWSKSRHAFTLFVISVPLFFALLAQIILWVCVFVLGRNGEFYSIRKRLENMVTISLFPTGI